MSKADQFRQYAEEALLWAAQSKTEEEKRRQIRDGARGLVRMKTRFLGCGQIGPLSVAACP